MSDDLMAPPARERAPGHQRERRALLVSQLRRGDAGRRRPGLVRGSVLAMVVLLVAAVGGYAAWSWWNQAPSAGGSASYRWHFDDPNDMVATADLVVLGEVTAAERGAVSDQGDVVYTARRLQVTVERRLFGTPAGPVVVVNDLGWERSRGREVPWRIPGMIRLEVGDRAILFLREEPTTGLFELLNDQAGYRVDGTGIADSDRSDPLVRRVEAMSVPELERLIEEAAAAVRQGRLQPVPEGGRRRPQGP